MGVAPTLPPKAYMHVPLAPRWRGNRTMDTKNLELIRITALKHVQRCRPTCPSSTICRYRHKRKNLRTDEPCMREYLQYRRFVLEVTQGHTAFDLIVGIGVRSHIITFVWGLGSGLTLLHSKVGTEGLCQQPHSHLFGVTRCRVFVYS